MKLHLLIFLFYIHYVISATDKNAGKYPKKVNSGKILIHSGRHVLKSKPTVIHTYQGQETTTKYTVFQILGSNKIALAVPDSPYFPLDHLLDHKIRVKKVLPDYIWTSLVRSKRAAEEPKKEETPQPLTPNKTEAEKDNLPTATTLKPAAKENETIHFRAHDNNDKDIEVKKVESKVETKPDKKGGIIKPQSKSKAEKKPARRVVAKPGRTSKKNKKPQRKGTSKALARKQSKKGRSGSRSKSKPKEQNGATTKKTKQTSNKPKARNSKNKQHLRREKGHKRNNNDSQKKKKGNSSSLTINPKETRRLTGARQAMIEDYPYVVSIQKEGVHWCSGALLNPRLVITTANCLWKNNRMTRMEIRAGSSFTDSGGQVAKIQEVMKHPGWGLRKNPDNDVALILLDRFIKFSHTVHGVDLPNSAMMPAFDDAWIVSWGSERRDGLFDDSQNNLQVYHAYLMSNETCNNITRRFGITVSPNFICFSQAGLAAPCTRDTGAPAVSDGILWGLASWGIRKLCGTERFPAMYSYTASHSNLDFITNATMYLMSDQRIYPFMDRLPPVTEIPT